MLAEKGYDADALRRTVRQGGAVPVILGRDHKRPIRHDRNRKHDQQLIEYAFGRLKDFRRVATRDDELAANSMSAPQSPSQPYDQVWHQ